MLAVAVAPVTTVPLSPRDGPPLTAAKSWGYQLQNARARAIPQAIDVMVVDYARDGLRTLRASDVEALKTRADGSRRIVLAYMSIGEAENYRTYWRTSWSYWPPSWLGPENPSWKGNYAVRYWDREWQRLIVDPEPAKATFLEKLVVLFDLRAKPYLDRIIEAGFDGVYLDRVDAYDTALDGRRSARADMVRFVGDISRHAKMRRPGFLIVPQNGEELLGDAGYRRSIDGVAKEDLLYGMAGDGVANSETDIKASLSYLDRVGSEGRPVFVVEYLSDRAQQITALNQLATRGYRVTFARRALNEPPELPVPAAAKNPSSNTSGDAAGGQSSPSN
jgi:cysteinyl-tRNA synthetase